MYEINYELKKVKLFPWRNFIFYYFVLPNSSETYCKLRYIDMLTLHNSYFSDYMLQGSQSTLVLLVVLMTNFSTWYIYFYLTERTVSI